jgi:hypothetical protein
MPLGLFFMKLNQLTEQQLATVLAALRLFQIQAEKLNMAQIFPDHFAEISPLSPEEIDQLCEELNTMNVPF